MRTICQLFVFVLFFAKVSACVGLTFHPCAKTYVSPHQLEIAREGIFVNLYENRWVQTDAIYTDKGGLFIQKLSLNFDGCPDPKVPCRWCKKCIYDEYYICPFCKKEQ